MTEQKQFFVSEIKGSFNLRKPKGSVPTLIYFVVRINGKQYKLATNVKVYPYQWDKKKQIAIVSNTQTAQDNRNSFIANEKLTDLLKHFWEFKQYLCNQNEVPTDIGALLKHYIYTDMANKRITKKNVDILKLTEDAFDYYYTYVSKSKKKQTREQNNSRLDSFREYINSLADKDKTIGVFSQSGLNAYRSFLFDKMESKRNSKRKFGYGRIDDCGELVARLINDVMCVNNEYLQYNISPVKWKKADAEDREQDEKGHFPLYDAEVQAIKDCTTLTDKEKEFRTLFLLQIECGQRVSDLDKLLTEDYKIKGDKIVLTTKKERIKAFIDITENVKQYLFTDIPNFTHVSINHTPQEGKFAFNHGDYNKALKSIAKKANLDREIKIVNSIGEEEISPLYEVVTSHCARYTFITNKIKEGMKANILCEMTGHADDRMINEVYAQLNEDDRINRLNAERDRVKGIKQEQRAAQATGNERLDYILNKVADDDRFDILLYIDKEHYAKKYGLTEDDVEYIKKHYNDLAKRQRLLNEVEKVSRVDNSGILKDIVK